MKTKVGYLYHIKNEYFDVIKDKNLMVNHEEGHTRPCCLVLKEGEILWFVPLSSKIEKYQKIIDKKIEKYGFCDSIIIKEIMEVKQVFLIQNAFPTLEKYIEKTHKYYGISSDLPYEIIKEIYNNCIKLFRMKRYGKNLFFSDIDKIKEQMENELEESKEKI